MPASKPREFAADVLVNLGNSPAFVEHRIPLLPSWQSLTPQDRRLAQELILGVIRWQATLDFLIFRKSKRPQLHPKIQRLLQLGLYQIFFLDRIPPHAAVHETVELARSLGLHAQSGFVNAILRGYLREKSNTQTLLQSLESSDPATAFSHQKSLINKWFLRWPPPQTLALLRWNNSPPKPIARLNTLAFSQSDLESMWSKEKVAFQPVEFPNLSDWRLYELQNPPPLDSLPSFQQGGFYIQDPSTLFAVEALDPKPGEFIVDLCAAPGGKTTAIAQKMDNQGRILASDSHPGRLDLLRENLQRLRVQIVEPKCPAPSPNPGAWADRVLVDAPCSNTGVFRRRAEARWRFTEQTLRAQTQLQDTLLDLAAKWVRPGGTLVYSTCSLEPEENRERVDSFLCRSPQFHLEFDRQIIPPTPPCDGAYIARLTRVSTH